MRPSKSFETRFSVVALLQFVLEIGSIASTEDDETETLPSYAVPDYRVPLKHPLLSAAVDPESELSFYFTKLDIGYPNDDFNSSTRKMILHKKWTDELLDLTILARNFDACELNKTIVSGTQFKYYDEVTDHGRAACHSQCMGENYRYYAQFLAEKLDYVMKRSPYYFDFRFGVPESYGGQEKMSDCERSAKMKYRCRCFYKNFNIRVCPHFERLFGKKLLEVREAKIENPDRENLVCKYDVPKTVLGFLIIYHLRPDDMFNYLLWWTLYPI